MSRTYCMDRDQADVIAMLQANQIPGLTHVHEPQDKNWPDGVTDGTNYGWFDTNLLEFWGANNEDPILHALAEHGVEIHGLLYNTEGTRSYR